MNSEFNLTAQHRLLEDALAPTALAASLAATRHAARSRRIGRRARRIAAIALVITAATWLIRPQLSHPPIGSTNRPVVAIPPRPSHLVIRTTSERAATIVRTAKPAAGLLLVVTNVDAHTISRATTDDLFALAGTRPAALHQLPDGSSRWMWLDRLTAN